MVNENILLYSILVMIGILLFLGMPVGLSFLFGGIVFVALTSITYFLFTLIPEYGFHTVDVFSLMAVPFFLLAGDLMKEGGLTVRLIAISDAFWGRVKGRMGAVTIISSMFFGAITGSSMACVAAIGSIMIPEMEKTGYRKIHAAALVTASGFLGILIPPSIPAIFLSVVTGISVGALFLATVIPGFLLAAGYLCINFFVYGRYLPVPEDAALKESFFSKARFKDMGITFYKGFFALLFPVIILGGIYGGVFSPTEAAVVAVIYSLVIGLFVYRGLHWNKIYDQFLTTGILSAVILILVAFVAPIGRIFSLLKFSDQVGNLIMSVSSNPFIVLLLLNISLLILGMFMETAAIIIITGPIFLPIAVKFGIDPIHFGAVMILNLGIGMLTPPFAYMLFVGARIANVSIERLIRPLLIFIVWCIITLIICTYIPSLTLFLPKLLLPY